jgi:GT2 family glycosyltransferase
VFVAARRRVETGAPFSCNWRFARLARLSFALDFGSDVAAIFHRRKFRAEVLYRRQDAILSSAFAGYHGAPEFLSNCGAAKYFIALCRDPADDACMVTRKDIFSDLDGFDENLPGNFNEVDFCLRRRERGWLIVWTPYANLIHHESTTRGRDTHARDRRRLFREASYMEKKRSAQILCDPYYSPNLSLHSRGFDLAFPPRWKMKPQ